MFKTYVGLIFTFLILSPNLSFSTPFRCYCHALVDNVVVKDLDNIEKFDSSNHRGSCEIACRDAIGLQVTDWCALGANGGQKREWYSADNKKGKLVDLGFYSCTTNTTTAIAPVLDSGCTWIITPSNPQFVPTITNGATCPSSVMNAFPYVAYCIRPQFIDQCYGWSPTQRSALLNVTCPANQNLTSGNNTPDTCVIPAPVAATAPAPAVLASAPDTSLSGRKLPPAKPGPSMSPPNNPNKLKPAFSSGSAGTNF